MNREIKSVKLKNDFRTSLDFVPKGTELIITNDKHHYIVPNQLIYYSIQQIENCKTDLFEIEYENERKSITVKIEYDSQYDLLPHDIHDVINSCDDLFTTISFNVIKVTEVENEKN